MEPQAPGADAPASEPAAPVTPAEPAAPVEPVAPDGGAEPTAEEAAQATEDKEWEDATDEIFPGLKKTTKKEEEKPDEPAKSEEKPQEGAADEAAATDKKPETEQGAGDEAAAKTGDGTGGEEEPGDGEGDGEGESPDTAALDARRAERAYKQDLENIKTDVRKKLYGEVPGEMRDAQGDPITSIEDVMQLVNPRTGDAFTREEAAEWFMSAQSQFNRNQDRINKEVEKIADLHMDLWDQTQVINNRYGALLREMPDVRDKAWKAFNKTLIKDEKTGVITDITIPLEEFYEDYLEPYAELGRAAEKAQKEDEAATKAAEEARKKQEEEERQRKRADRSDIYGGTDKDNQDPEDKEWDQAATAVFGPRK